MGTQRGETGGEVALAEPPEELGADARSYELYPMWYLKSQYFLFETEEEY